MVQVGLPELAKKTGLDPKIIRRLIRKNSPRGDSEKGKYLWDDTNPAYKKVLQVCKEFKATLGTKEVRRRERPAEEKQASDRVRWDDRGLCILGGGAWVPVMVPDPRDPTKQDVVSVYLGPETEVKKILSRDQAIPEGCHPLARRGFEKLLAGTLELPEEPRLASHRGRKGGRTRKRG